MPSRARARLTRSRRKVCVPPVGEGVNMGSSSVGPMPSNARIEASMAVVSAPVSI